jgi:hypothetical protein
VKFLWRAILVVAIFIGFGYAIDRAVLTHSRNAATPESQVRLSAAMAGLFGGGAVASVVTLALAFTRKS